MEHAENKTSAHLNSLEKALGTLKEVLERSPEDDHIRDAAIHRFEYVFELSWKTIQAAARFLGKGYDTPREAIRIAFKKEWITDGDFWMKALEARNQTSHTYNEAVAESVYAFVKTFPPVVDELLASLRKLEGIS